MKSLMRTLTIPDFLPSAGRTLNANVEQSMADADLRNLTAAVDRAFRGTPSLSAVYTHFGVLTRDHWSRIRKEPLPA